MVAQLSVKIKSSNVGIGCLSLFMARFAILMSTHTLTSPLFFGVITSGDTHRVGPLTRSIMPFSSRLSSSALTFWRM